MKITTMNKAIIRFAASNGTDTVVFDIEYPIRYRTKCEVEAFARNTTAVFGKTNIGNTVIKVSTGEEILDIIRNVDTHKYKCYTKNNVNNILEPCSKSFDEIFDMLTGKTAYKRCILQNVDVFPETFITRVR